MSLALQRNAQKVRVEFCRTQQNESKSRSQSRKTQAHKSTETHTCSPQSTVIKAETPSEVPGASSVNLSSFSPVLRLSEWMSEGRVLPLSTPSLRCSGATGSPGSPNPGPMGPGDGCGVQLHLKISKKADSSPLDPRLTRRTRGSGTSRCPSSLCLTSRTSSRGAQFPPTDFHCGFADPLPSSAPFGLSYRRHTLMTGPKKEAESHFWPSQDQSARRELLRSTIVQQTRAVAEVQPSQLKRPS